MHPATRDRLLQLNRHFYRQTGREFSGTRRREWRGWRRVLESLPAPGDRRARLSILDLGSGNGRFIDFLAKSTPGRAAPGRPGIVSVELDDSLTLLAESTASDVDPRLQRHRLCADVLTLGRCLAAERCFDLVVAFGLLHHIPGRKQRSTLIQRAADRVAPEGSLALSFWQFADEPSLRSRIVDWDDSILDRMDLPSAADVEQGDHLLHWGPRHEVPVRLRYCHHSSDEEIAEIERTLRAREPAGSSLESYRADGRNDRLNRYLLLRRGGSH